MPPPLYPPAGPQTIGQVLDTGFRIFQISLVRCLLYSALGMIAGQLPNIYVVLARKATTGASFRDPAWVSLYVVGVLVSLTLYAMLLLRQHRIVTGQRTSLRTELAAAVRRLPAILGATLLALFVVGLWVGLVMLLAAFGKFGGAPRWLALGSVTLVMLPVLYASIPFSLVTPALMIDGRKVLDAIRYAFSLVRGNWWRTVVIYSVVGVVIIAFYVVATIVAGVLAFSVAGADVVALTASAAVIYVALGALGLPFSVGALLSIFGELKVRREAVDLEMRIGEVART